MAELAAAADVPPSALMRFCQILGYSGFSEMQKLFREAYAPGFPDYATRLKNLKDGGSGTPSALLAEFIEAGRLSLEALAQSADEAALAQAVTVLAGAEMVHVIGLRRAFPVATYLTYIFEKMSVPAMLHDGVGKLDHRHALRTGDAVLAITFAPYSEETIALAQDARDRGLPVVALQDRRVRRRWQAQALASDRERRQRGPGAPQGRHRRVPDQPQGRRSAAEHASGLER